jgi:hypothetical protein
MRPSYVDHGRLQHLPQLGLGWFALFSRRNAPLDSGSFA